MPGGGERAGLGLPVTVSVVAQDGNPAVEVLADVAAGRLSVDEAEKLLTSNFAYVDGQKYSEFKAGDKVAAYGLSALVLGGAGIVMFGMVAATGIRILSTVDFKGNRNNLYIVAIAIGFGLVPLVAPRWSQQMSHSLHPLLESGILLTAVAAVVLNIFFNGAREDRAGAVDAAKLAEAH